MAKMANPTIPLRGSIAKAFLAFISNMEKMTSYLSWVAFVEAYGKPVKVDDMVITLSHKARALSTWSTKNL